MDLYCYTCLTGTCLAAGPHAVHRKGEGAEVQAVTARGGTPLCRDCANDIADSRIMS